MIQTLFEIITDRKSNPVAGSYTNQLLESGRERLAQKVGEEAVELIVASVSQGRKRIIEEASDLLYHLLVLLSHADIAFDEIEGELKQRHVKNKEIE